MAIPTHEDTSTQHDPAARRIYWGSVAAAVISIFAAVTPAFTVGAVTVSMTKDFGINVGLLGVALASFFAFTAIGSPVSTMLAERLSPALQLSISAFLAGCTMLGIGDASHFGSCLLLLVVGGLANSLVQPAVGRILGAVPSHRLSFVSGLLQAAMGSATFPAFLLLRFVSEPYGWRAGFTVGGSMVLLSAIVIFGLAHGSGVAMVKRKSNVAKTRTAPVQSARRTLYLWTFGAALGTVAVTGIASFFISIATGEGFSVSEAASLALAISGLAALIRIVVGLIADKRPDANITLVVGMMVVGTIGLIVISFHVRSLFLVGSLVAVIGLFGWNGLLVAAAIRLIPSQAVKTMGWLQVGFFTGATLAPMVFGALLSQVGVRWAILTTAACVVVGAIMVMFGEMHRGPFTLRDG